MPMAPEAPKKGAPATPEPIPAEAEFTPVEDAPLAQDPSLEPLAKCVALIDAAQSEEDKAAVVEHMRVEPEAIRKAPAVTAAYMRLLGRVRKGA